MFELSNGLLCIAPSRLYETPKPTPPATEIVTLPGIPPMPNIVGLNRRARQGDQIGNITPVERQFQNTLILDDLADADVSCFDHRRVRLHFNLFSNLADFESWINYRVAVYLEDDSGLYVSAESRQSSFDAIGA